MSITLDQIARQHGGELERHLRHLRGINSTDPLPADLVDMAESEAAFFQGYARAMKHYGVIDQEGFAALVHEILQELEEVYLEHAPHKACLSEDFQ